MNGTHITWHQITWLERGWWLELVSFHTAAVTTDHGSIISSNKKEFKSQFILTQGPDAGPDPVQHGMSTVPNPVQHSMSTGPDPVQHGISTDPNPVRHSTSTGPDPVRHGMSTGPDVVQVLGAAVWKEQRVQSPGTKQTSLVNSFWSTWNKRPGLWREHFNKDSADKPSTKLSNSVLIG